MLFRERIGNHHLIKRFLVPFRERIQNHHLRFSLLLIMRREALVSVLENDVIEKSQGMESSSASMAVLLSGFPAAVFVLAIDR